jgi:hypothetical protein
MQFKKTWLYSYFLPLYMRCYYQIQGDLLMAAYSLLLVWKWPNKKTESQQFHRYIWVRTWGFNYYSIWNWFIAIIIKLNLNTAIYQCSTVVDMGASPKPHLNTNYDMASCRIRPALLTFWCLKWIRCRSHIPLRLIPVKRCSSLWNEFLCEQEDNVYKCFVKTIYGFDFARINIFCCYSCCCPQ